MSFATEEPTNSEDGIVNNEVKTTCNIKINFDIFDKEVLITLNLTCRNVEKKDT